MSDQHPVEDGELDLDLAYDEPATWGHEEQPIPWALPVITYDWDNEVEDQPPVVPLDAEHVARDADGEMRMPCFLSWIRLLWANGMTHKDLAEVLPYEFGEKRLRRYRRAVATGIVHALRNTSCALCSTLDTGTLRKEARWALKALRSTDPRFTDTWGDDLDAAIDRLVAIHRSGGRGGTFRYDDAAYHRDIADLPGGAVHWQSTSGDEYWGEFDNARPDGIEVGEVSWEVPGAVIDPESSDVYLWGTDLWIWCRSSGSDEHYWSPLGPGLSWEDVQSRIADSLSSDADLGCPYHDAGMEVGLGIDLGPYLQLVVDGWWRPCREHLERAEAEGAELLGTRWRWQDHRWVQSP